MYQFRVLNDDLTQSLAKLSVLMSDQGLVAFLGTAIGPYLKKRAADRFASQGDDVSGAWKPLSPATIAIRQDGGFGAGPINRRTGELENCAVQSGWDAYPITKGATMRFPGKKPGGRLKEKVITAQEGRSGDEGPDYPRTVPRPVVGVNETDMLFFQTALTFAIQDAMQ